MKELRDKFYKECVDKSKGQVPKINMHPHDLFKWFEKEIEENYVLRSFHNERIKKQEDFYMKLINEGKTISITRT